MPNFNGPQADRRQGDRQVALQAAQIQLAEGPPTLAMIQNVSPTGALLFTGASFEPGTVLPLKLLLAGSDADGVAAEGEVVRCTRRDGQTLWRHEVAVRFRAPLPLRS